MKHREYYNIKNIESIEHNLTININTKEIMLNHRYKPLSDNYIDKFYLEKIGSVTYNLVFNNNDIIHKEKCQLVFSSKTSTNPLFFNIIILRHKKYLLYTKCQGYGCSSNKLNLSIIGITQRYRQTNLK